MTILITGGKGFLGAAVARCLVNAGHDVVCLDVRAAAGRLEAITDKLTLISDALDDVEAVERVIRKHRVDRIAHMVYTKPRDDGTIHTELSVNAFSAAHVFEASRRADVSRVVFPSSIHCYGPQWLHGDYPLTEESPALASTFYGVSKRFVESVAREYICRSGIDIVCLRVPAVYGPGALAGARGVNVAAVEAARARPAVLPYRADENVCTAHVDDVAAIVVELLLAPVTQHNLYNIGGHTTTYWGIAALVKEAIPDAVIRFAHDGAPTDLPYLINDDRLRTEFTVAHRPLAAGMRQLIDSIRGEGLQS